MRISDWSSDVCSSDLDLGPHRRHVDLQIFHTRQKRRLRRLVQRAPQADYPAVHRLRRAGAQGAVQCRNHIMDNAEVCVVELELDDAIARKRGGHRALDDGAIGNDAAVDLRSEEHKSELQSLMSNSYAV